MITLFYTFSELQLKDQEFRTLLSYLPETDQKQILRYRRWQDRQSHLIGRFLLLYGLVERGLPFSSLERLKFNAYGKPFVDAKVNFNLSHSGSCVVCAVTDRGSIGVDVEAVKDIDLAAFNDCVNDGEWSKIQQSTDKQIAFFKCWTKKEAVIKADGRGLSIPLRQINLNDESAVLTGKSWYLKTIDLGRPYICHLAIDRCDSDLIMKEMKTKEHSNNWTRIHTDFHG